MTKMDHSAKRNWADIDCTQELPNARVLADRYAKRTGCRVYTPDFMNGHWIPHDLLESMEYIMKPQPTWGATLYKV
jgi:hypothetical protein